MSIDSHNLLNTRFQLDLAAGDWLAYNTTNRQIFVKKAGVLLDPNCTDHLSYIDREARRVLNSVSLNTLQPTQLLNLTHNVEAINRDYTNYNSKNIENNFILNLLDKILYVVTLGFFRLQCTLLDTDALVRLASEITDPETDRPAPYWAALVEYLSEYPIDSAISERSELLYYNCLKGAANHLCELTDSQKKVVLRLANTMNYWSNNLNVTIHALNFLLKECKDLHLNRIKDFFIDYLFDDSTHYNPDNPDLENIKEPFIYLFSQLAFEERDLFRDKGVPTFAEEMLRNFASKPDHFPKDYLEILGLVLSCLEVAPVSSSSKERIQKILHEMLNNGYEIDLNVIDPKFRLRFLTTVAESWLQTPIGYHVFKMCCANYDKLSKEEKEPFFKMLIEYDAGLTAPRPMIIELAAYLAAQKPFNAILAQQVILKINSYSALTEKEIPAVLALANCLNFSAAYVSHELTKHLGRHTFKLIEYLEKEHPYKSMVPESVVPYYNNIALQLCFWGAGCVKQEQDQAALCTILQNVNISKADPKIFEIITKGDHPLSKLFSKDPERYLSMADEGQLELYYERLEKALAVDERHLNMVVGTAQEIPELPPGTVVDLRELVGMFDQINFTDPARPGYVNPATLVEEQTLYTPAELRTAIKRIVDDIEANRVTFVPTEERQKAKFYRDLRLYLQHSILKLRTRRPEDRPGFLIRLAFAGLACGGRYFGMAQDLYYQVTGTRQVIDAETLEGGLLKILEPRRAAIFEDEVAKMWKLATGRLNADVDVHAYAEAMKIVGKWFNVAKAEQFQFDDPAPDGCKYPFSGPNASKAFNQLYKDCLSAYSPTVIINEIYKHFVGITGHPKTITLDFQCGALNQWFKEDGLTHKKKEESILPETYHPETMRLKRERLIYLLHHVGNILEKPSARNFWHFGKRVKSWFSS